MVSKEEEKVSYRQESTKQNIDVEEGLRISPRNFSKGSTNPSNNLDRAPTRESESVTARDA